MHLIKLQTRRMGHERLDTVEGRIDRPVAGLAGALFRAVDIQNHVGLLGPFRAADDCHGNELEPLILRVGRCPHQGDEVVLVDFLFAVGQFLEPHEDVLELVVPKLVAEVLKL